MVFKRQPRKIGDIISLGGVSYEIEAVEGYGASAIVYKAFYRDELSKEALHQVFIKELFPVTEEGSIYRSENGDIVTSAAGEAQMDDYRKHFLVGNKINLELLNQSPSGTSGNINSYEAFGTYYSVLSVHGGVNLETLINENGQFDLKEAALIIKRVLKALDIFHQNKMLHLDISPDNILLLPEQAILIDYNSVWDTRYISAGSFHFSEKAYYTPSEIHFKYLKDIGYASDLYSVCAVFYQLIFGRPFDKKEISGNALKTNFSSIVAPETAIFKAAQIIVRGLHDLPRKRYQSVAELQAELDELINRIDGRGISHSALWERSRSAFVKLPNAKDRYIPQDVLLDSGRKITKEELLSELQNGKLILLNGPGGMGKTRIMMELWKQNVKKYYSQVSVILYVALKDYQSYAGEPLFIRKMILKELCFSDKQKDFEDALHELDLLFAERSKKAVNIVLLLDGLNESGSKRQMLLREIEELGNALSVGILVTERTNEVQEYGLKAFTAAELLPLSDETAIQELIDSGSRMPDTQDLRDMLRNPMMLSIYKNVMHLEKENLEDSKDTTKIHSVDDLVKMYLDELLTFQLRISVGDEGMQLNYRYILQHLLPAVAVAMSKRKKSILSYDELFLIVKQSYANLNNSAFNRSFREYTGKSRTMLGAMNQLQWFDFAISEQLVGNMGLLVQNSSGSYSLVHDNFQSSLISISKRNKVWRYRSPRFYAGIFSLIVLVAVYGWSALRSTDMLEKIDAGQTNSTKYYLNMAMVYDSPVGIGEITEAEIKKANSYYKIVTDNGEVSKYSFYQKSGYDNGLVVQSADTEMEGCSYFKDNNNLFNGYNIKRKSVLRLTEQGISANLNYTDINSWGDRSYRIVSATDEIETSTSYTLAELPFCHGKFLSLPEDAARVMRYYTDEGYIQSEMFLDANITGKNFCANKDGVAGIEFECDQDGLVSGQYYLNSDQKRMAVNGIYKITCKYSSDGQITEMSFLDEHGELVSGETGWALLKCDYDGDHNLSREIIYDESGEIINSVDYEYESGLMTDGMIHNAEGEVAKGLDGYAEERIKYKDGFLVSEEYFDERGNPCSGPSGYSKRVVELAKNEGKDTFRVVSVQFHSDTGELCMNEKLMLAKVVYEYTKDNRLYKVSFYDQKGKLCNGTGEFAQIECAGQNSEGYFSEVYWYAADGSIVDHIEDKDYENKIMGVSYQHKAYSLL